MTMQQTADRNAPSQELGFTLLEARIAGLPDGPVSMHATPLGTGLNLLGIVGVLIAVLPSALVTFMTPQHWMLWMARAGLAITLIGLAPGFVRMLWLLLRGTLRWKTEFNQQLDFDLDQLTALKRELARFPEDALRRHHAFVIDAQARLDTKLGFLAGSLERLGLLPLGLSLVIAVHNAGGLDAIAQVPTWLVCAGLLVAGGALPVLLGAHTRLRLQLYQMVLAGALDEQRACPPIAGAAPVGSASLPAAEPTP